MTYLQFHLVFLLPPLLGLAGLQAAWFRRQASYRARLVLPAMALIALLYTTPWDNYLVYRGVWSYGPDRVWTTLGYVPIEEYLFFVLQPLLTGLYFYHELARGARIPNRPDAPLARWTGTGLGLLLTALGGGLLWTGSTLYLGLILIWSGPVLAGQWAYAGGWFWSLRRLWSRSVLVPTLYLWGTDWVALRLGTWSLSDRYTTGVTFAGLPLEEAVFFLVTNLLVVQGIIMLHRFDHVPKS